MPINKKHNQYAGSIDFDLYAAIPKAVWAAIAISALTCGGDQLSHADTRAINEWAVLHANGIVPQTVPARWLRHLERFGEDDPWGDE